MGDAPAKPISAGHNPALDGVRGIAVAMVMFYHTTQIFYGENAFDDVVMMVAKSCWSGVDLFFVLSGFLITGILLDSNAQGTRGEVDGRQRRFFWNFYGRRALRILPLAVLYIAFFAWILPNLPHTSGTPWASFVERNAPAHDQQLWLWFFASNFAVAFHGWILGDAGVMWSLAIEEQFYFVWPALVAWCAPRRLVRVCVVLVLLAILARLGLILAGAGWMSNGTTLATWWSYHPTSQHPITWWMGYTLPITRMDGLAIGGLLALVVRGHAGNPATWLRHATWIAPLALLACIAVGIRRNDRFGQLYNQDVWVQLAGFTLLAVAFAGLVLHAFLGRPKAILTRTLSLPPLVLFGKYSYCLYLVHWPVTTLAMAYFEPKDFLRWHGSAMPGHLAFYALTWGGSLALAHMSWHLYEKHFLKLRFLFPR